jgi:excisionase family DNA binding protein
MVTQTGELLSGNTVSVEEAAEILHISRSVAYESVKNGRLPALKFGARRIRIPVAAIKKMLETVTFPRY